MLVRWAVRLISLAALVAAVFLLVTTSTGAGTGQEQSAEVRRAAAARSRGKTSLRPLDPAVGRATLTREYSRRVLGLYNSLDPQGKNEEGRLPAESNNIHRRVELILNHLGLMVELRDVNDPLLDDSAMARYLGVVTWFAGTRMKKPREYLLWLTHQMEQGRKVVLLGGPGVATGALGQGISQAELNQMLATLGLRYLGNVTRDSDRIRVERKVPAMVEFERKLPARLEYYEQYKLLDPAGVSYLELRRTDLTDGASDMVSVTPQGGLAASSVLTGENRLGNTFVQQWYLDPFRFFTQALGLAQTPRPDFTTLNGSWIFYSHIDGDGLPSITWVDRKSMCGDFTRTQVLERYDLPVTVSFVVAGIAPPPLGVGNRHRLEVARKVARLPNVEVGVHGFAHPMNWRARKQALCSYDVKGYRMTAEMEITKSAAFIDDNICPPGKRTTIMLWTGWCNPAGDQLAVAYKAGLYNLNGGDPIKNEQYPSYLHLAPVIHKVGKYRQYYTSGPNDYILTEEWKEPYYRWENLIQHFKAVNSPHRMYPMNVYYHFYVVERASALAAMHRIFNWVLSRQPAGIWASQYVDVVRDFEDMRIEQVGQGESAGWRVLNSGYCRTVRFDRMNRHVDLKRSRGVLGYRRLPKQGALYVHLDESHDHSIFLSSEVSREPYLQRASAYVRSFSATRDKVKLITRGVGRKHITVANLAPGARYMVLAVNEQGQRRRASLITSGWGGLDWQGDINGGKIKVTITREKKR